MPSEAPPAAAGVSPSSPVTVLEGVGPSRARALEGLGVRTLHELLHYFPRDYQREHEGAAIAELSKFFNSVVTVQGEITACNYIAGGGRPRFEVTLADEETPPNKLAITFFGGAYLRSKLHPGLQLQVKGKVRMFRNLPQMQNPKWAIIHESSEEAGSEEDPELAGSTKSTLKPIYPATANLPSDAIGKLVAAALPLATLPETLPAGLLQKRRLMPRGDAFRQIHFPASKRDAIDARKRIMYDELLAMQVGLALSRAAGQGKLSAPILRCDKTLDARIKARFPFPFTVAQTNATYEIIRDLASGRAMNRLLQGDVGSGKTAVALYAMLIAVANKMQAALLAPTEVLAEQHYLTLSRFLKDSSVSIELVTSRTKRQSRGALTRALADGRIHIAVGTQALLQQDIDFANLGLVVVDEQHRLGVEQRATLRGKGMAPHYLVMTATPIPRTLALSYFADFDLTLLNELPPGRTPITTQLVATRDQAQAWNFLKSEVATGRQAYIIVPKIGLTDRPAAAPLLGAETEETAETPVFEPEDEATLVSEFKRLADGPLKGLRLLMLHGAMAADEKQRVMEDFRGHRADVLLATTVIEVGIDVPNATMIVIESADQFGLSQLHQLRGRVGRGEHASFCVLLSDAATGARGDADDAALTRLNALVNSTSGFELSELDFQLRGPGQFFGTRQHGLPEFRLADLTQESNLLADAREDAQALLKADPGLKRPESAALRAEIQAQFGQALPIATVG